MSMSFEIFPTKKRILRCDEIMEYSIQLFSEFMQKKNIEYDMEVTAREVYGNNKVQSNPITLVTEQDYYTVFDINGTGEVYAHYYEETELDKEFWNEELQKNKNAQAVQEKINANLELGYFWSIKRTMGQPAIVSLYYGYLAIAIAILTDGLIYSDDGAWDYSRLPIEGSIFKDEYLNLDKIRDIKVKENIKRWLDEWEASVF